MDRSPEALGEFPEGRGGTAVANARPLPQLGQIARVRQRAYLVEQVLLPPQANQSTLVRLSCLDDDAQGQPLAVLWENEIDAEIVDGERWDLVASRGFDDPAL